MEKWYSRLGFKNNCSHMEDTSMQRKFLLVDVQVLPEVFIKVVRAKELLASGAAAKR